MPHVNNVWQIVSLSYYSSSASPFASRHVCGDRGEDRGSAAKFDFVLVCPNETGIAVAVAWLVQYVSAECCGICSRKTIKKSCFMKITAGRVTCAS